MYRPDAVNHSELEQLKFIGGTNTDAPEDLNPEMTLIREFKTESGAEVTYYLPLHQAFKPGRSGRTDHRQYFCLVEFKGELRTEPLWDGKELLEAPHWRVFDETLLRDIFPSHREALVALGNLLRQKIVLQVR